jgi:hypothetical protein
VQRELMVKTWITSIEEGVEDDEKRPDALSLFDRYAEGQIGAWGDKLEYVIDTEREVPIWEFRDLGDLPRDKLLLRLQRIVKAITDLHQRYPTKPTLSVGPSR